LEKITMGDGEGGVGSRQVLAKTIEVLEEGGKRKVKKGSVAKRG